MWRGRKWKAPPGCVDCWTSRAEVQGTVMCMNLELRREADDGDSSVGGSPQMVLPAIGLEVGKMTKPIFQRRKPRLRTAKCGTRCEQSPFFQPAPVG